MATRFDMCSPRPKKDGGSFWVKVGTGWQSDKSFQLVFDALPLPDSEGRCVVNLFEPRERNDAPPQRQSQSQQLDDDIPF